MNVDYKDIADGLQKDLLEKIKEAEKLQDEVDRLESDLKKKNDELERYIIIDSLDKIQLKEENKKLKEKNEQLEKENEHLEYENDLQAEHYVELRKENKRLENITQIYSLPSPIPEDPEKEEIYKSVVTKNLPNFVKYTDFTTLTPFLYQYKLLMADEHDKLETLTHDKKANHFYVQVLGTKGKAAYTTFYHCLKKARQDSNCHQGHTDLLKLLNNV